MSSVIDMLNHVAVLWWPYVLHLAWQASVVAALMLVVVKFGRRWPAPLRYWLLVIALAKFAVPPLLPMPTGLFDFVGSPSKRDASTEKELAVARVSSGRSPRPSEASLVSTSSSGKSSQTIAPIVQTPAESESPFSFAIAGLRSLSWKGWLLLAYTIGCAVATWQIALQVARLLRLSGRAGLVSSGDLCQRFLDMCRRIGLRRRARLLVSQEAIAPMAFGVLRPVVVVPSGMIERLSPREVATILAHELTHLRRGDSLVNWIQIVLGALWWFNPVMWLLNRSIRRTREECCDDLLLAAGITNSRAYCETLLHAARGLGAQKRAAAALGFADKLHPLGARFKRIMDSTLRRSAKLSMAGFFLIAILAGLVLPGLRLTAEPAGTTAEKTPSQKSGEKADASVKPRLQMRLVAEEGDEGPADVMVETKTRTGEISKLRVLKEVLFKGPYIESAEVRSARDGAPEIYVKLTKTAAEKFGEITARNIGRRLAIVFDGELLIAPVIRSRISGGDIVIEGRFSRAKAEEIVAIITGKKRLKTEGEAGRPRHFVRMVVSKDAITFEGRATTWDDVKTLLSRVPDRRNTVLELATATDNLTPQKSNEAKAQAGQLSHELGFEYPSYIGVHPLGSKALRSSFIGQLAFDRQIPLEVSVGADDHANVVQSQWIRFQKNEREIDATLRVGWTSIVDAKWRIIVGVGGPIDLWFTSADRSLVTRRAVKGLPKQSDVDLKFELGPLDEVRANKFVVTLAKDTEGVRDDREPLDRDVVVMKKLEVPAGIVRWGGEDIKTLQEAVEYLMSLAEVNIFVHPNAVSSAGTPAKDCKVSFATEADMTFEDILNKLTKPQELLWTIRNLAVIIADAKTMPAIVKKRYRRGHAIEKADQAAWERLEKESGVTFPGGQTTLEDIRAIIAHLAEVNMFIHPLSQSPRGLPLADTPFEFRTITPDMTFENILNNVTALLMADWTVRNQAVIIATPDRIASIEKLPSHKDQPKDEVGRKVWEKLHRRSRITFPRGETTLVDIAELISAPQLLGVEIEIDAGAKSGGLPLADAPFTFPLVTPDMTFEHLLDSATTLLDADWTIRHEKIFISTPDRLDLQKQGVQ